MCRQVHAESREIDWERIRVSGVPSSKCMSMLLLYANISVGVNTSPISESLMNWEISKKFPAQHRNICQVLLKKFHRNSQHDLM